MDLGTHRYHYCANGVFPLFHYSTKTVELAPNILTSIGIFGTFLGVALGLWSFDTT
jgi:hypothetical protein